MNKIHYQTKPGHNACGLARGAEMSPDLSQVTCKSCLHTVAGRKFGRPQKKEGKPTKKVSITLSDKAYQKYQDIPKGDRSEWVSKLIEDV